MTNKEKTTYILIAIGITLLIWTIYSVGRPSGAIVKLYEQKGRIVTQKADLLKQDLDIRNKIDNINKEIAEIDAQLNKAINPEAFTEESGLTPIQQLDKYISGQEMTGH